MQQRYIYFKFDRDARHERSSYPHGKHDVKIVGKCFKKTLTFRDKFFMEYNFSTLIVLAEVPTAFVEFSAIIASIRVTFTEALTKFQNLLVHFFTESGMLGVSVCLLPMVLWQFVFGYFVVV